VKRVRLKDIADEVAVSKTAVSRVLNGHPIRISPRKREHIVRTAQRLGYRPNVIARSLQNKTTKSIAIVVPDMSTLFYPEIIRSIEMQLASRGYKTIISNSEDDPVREKEQIEDLLSRLVDGFVIAPAFGRENIDLFRGLHRSARPFILIDRTIPGEDFRYIVTDNKAGAREGTRWLAAQGKRRVVFIGDEHRNQAVEERLQGVREEANALGLRLHDEGVHLCPPHREQVARACRPLLRGDIHEVGVFLESNRFLMGLLDACVAHGLTVPGDVTVIGFDSFEPELTVRADFDALGALAGPIAIIRQSVLTMGNLVSEYLVSSFEDGAKRAWQIMLPVELIAP